MQILSPYNIFNLNRDLCGGWTTNFNRMSFINVKYKTLHRWNWDVVMKDLDGSLSGKPGNVIVSRTNITDGDTRCSVNPSLSQGAVCSNTTDWIRFAFNNAVPSSSFSITIKNSKNNTDIGYI